MRLGGMCSTIMMVYRVPSIVPTHKADNHAILGFNPVTTVDPSSSGSLAISGKTDIITIFSSVESGGEYIKRLMMLTRVSIRTSSPSFQLAGIPIRLNVACCSASIALNVCDDNVWMGGSGAEMGKRRDELEGSVPTGGPIGNDVSWGR